MAKIVCIVKLSFFANIFKVKKRLKIFDTHLGVRDDQLGVKVKIFLRPLSISYFAKVRKVFFD